MITRRFFLGGVAGLALGGRTLLQAADASERGDAPSGPRLADDPAYRQYLSDLAACDRQVLGVPRRRSLV